MEKINYYLYSLILTSLVSFSTYSQLSDLIDVNWTLYPNYDLPDSLESGDSIIFLMDDKTDYNPKITLSVKPDGEVWMGMTSFSYETRNGIIVSREESSPTYTVFRDTLTTGDTLTIVEYKTENFIRYNHGPAIASVCKMELTKKDNEFSCGIVIGYRSGDVLKGPFKYFVRDDKLILMKI